MSDFLGKKVDYWALGHIHKRRILRESPYAVYSGNIQGRSSKETGPKGAYVVTVTDGKVSELRFVPTHSMQWSCLEADLTGLDMDGLASKLENVSESTDIASLTLYGRGGLMTMLNDEPSGFRKELQSRVPFMLASLETSPEPREDGELAAKIRAAAASMESEGRRAYERAIMEDPCMAEHSKIIAPMTDRDLKRSAGRATEALIRMTEGER